MSIRWVLFDAVGTLIYADPPVAEAITRPAGNSARGLTIEEIASELS